MNHRWLSHALVSFTSLLTLAFAVAAVPSARADELPPISGPSSGGVYEATLANGMKVLMKEVHTAPLLCVSVWYRAGSSHESNGTTGLAHLLEHMMFKGTEQYGKGVYDRLLEANGAVNNASTWLDRTQYFVLIAADRADLALELEADRMRNALFTQQDLDDEMPVVRNEMEKGEDDPYSELDDRLQSMAILEHPYHWPTIGWKTDVESITAEQIHAYYDKYYWPNNSYLVLVGDLPASAMLEKAVRFFGPLAAGGESPRVATVEPEQKGERRFLIREAGQTRILGLAWRSVARSDHDGYALDLLGRILGSGETSRLYHGLVESGLATDVNAGNRSWFKYPYLFEAYVTVAEGADPDSAERAVYAEIARLKSEAPSKAELARAIKQAKVETLFERDDVTSLMFSIGEAENAGNYHFYETYLDSLAAVTPEEVRAAAETYLVDHARTVGFYLPDGQAGGSWTADSDPESNRNGRRERAADASGSARPFTLDDSRAWRFDPRELEPASLVRVGPTESIPRGRSVGNALGAPSGDRTGGASGRTELQPAKGIEARPAALPTKTTLANGIGLIVQESHENPTIALEGRLVGGLLTEPAGKEGVAALVAQTLTKGTTQHSAAELAELLESNGISLSFDAAADHISMSARCLAEDFPQMIALLGEVLTSATFPADQVDIARAQLVASLKERTEDTDSRSRRAALEAGYGANSPYARFAEGTEESLNALTSADLSKYRDSMLAGSRWSLALVGDVTTDKAKKLLGTALKSVPAGTPFAVTPPTWNPPSSRDPIRVEMPDKSQTDIVYVGPGVAPGDPSRDAAFLANVILGGSFTSRLNGELRDNQGLTYGAGSRLNDRLGGTYWAASLGVNPENVEKGLEGVQHELDKVVSPGFTEDELKRGQEYAAGSFPIRLQSKDEVAALLLFADAYGLGLDYASTFAARMRKVTLPEVQAAVARFTDRSKMAVAAAGTFAQP